MSKIQQQVMASVLVIYWARKLTSARAIKAYALVLSGVALGTLVSVPDVLANLMGVGLSGVAAFLIAAVSQTTPLVQVSTLVAIVMAGLLVRDAALSRHSFS